MTEFSHYTLASKITVLQHTALLTAVYSHGHNEAYTHSHSRTLADAQTHTPAGYWFFVAKQRHLLAFWREAPAQRPQRLWKHTQQDSTHSGGHASHANVALSSWSWTHSKFHRVRFNPAHIHVTCLCHGLDPSNFLSWNGIEFKTNEGKKIFAYVDN